MSLSLGILIYDALTTRIWSTRTDNVLFPLSKADHQLHLVKELSQSKIKALVQYISPKRIHLTFDHLRQSYDVIGRLTKMRPEVNFNKYRKLFNQIDFNNEDLKSQIEAQFLSQDDFLMQSIPELIQKYGLPQTATRYQVMQAYLADEMNETIRRLNTCRSKDLPRERLISMNNQAAHALDCIEKNWQGTRKLASQLLLKIAFQTGSHCNRMYCETFSEIYHEYIVQDSLELTTQERIVLSAQKQRERAVKSYYYKMVSILKADVPVMDSLLEDANDYHTYEVFMYIVGPSLYVYNPLLGQALVKSWINLLVAHYFKWLLDEFNLSFTDDYNVLSFIETIKDSTSEMHRLFKTWLDQEAPEFYDSFLTDEDGILDVKNNLKLIHGLAKLFLLDNDIAEMDNSLEHDDLNSEPSLAAGALSL